MHSFHKMGKVPKKLSSSTATKATSESDSDSLPSKEYVPKVELPSCSFPKFNLSLTRQKLQGIKLYVGLGILTLGVSATVAVIILRRQRLQKLKKRANRYDLARPKSESDSMTTTETQHAFELYSGLQEVRNGERGNALRLPGDVPGLESALMSEDNTCKQCSYTNPAYTNPTYEDDSPQSEHIKRWSSYLTFFILMVVVVVVVWRGWDYFVPDLKMDDDD